MKSYEIYACRRKALRITRQELADRARVHVQFVNDFEKGLKIPRVEYDRIKTTIREMFNELDSIEHYRTRILELGIELRDETDADIALQEIAHMMIELGKLQNELMGIRIKSKEDWEV